MTEIVTAAAAPEVLVDKHEIGRRFGLKPATIAKWAREGKIPSARVSYRTVRFSVQQVAEVLLRVREEGQ